MTRIFLKDSINVDITISLTDVLRHECNLVYTKTNNIALSFIDVALDPYNPHSFTRTLKNSVSTFVNSVQIKTIKQLSPRWIPTLKRDLTPSERFMTQDFECYCENNVFHVYAAAVYDGTKYKNTSKPEQLIGAVGSINYFYEGDVVHSFSIPLNKITEENINQGLLTLNTNHLYLINNKSLNYIDYSNNNSFMSDNTMDLTMINDPQDKDYNKEFKYYLKKTTYGLMYTNRYTMQAVLKCDNKYNTQPTKDKYIFK